MTDVLSFDHVTKEFRGAQSYRALRDEISDVLARRRRKAQGGQPVRALTDVSFDIPEGSAVALMGPNGSGKTTALKIISRVTYPTRGTVRVRGRVGALIEVGTGLHPELTGRENIQLYGRILGISRSDILHRFDEIVEFAEIGRALDQPVKQYSSGMQLRLGFSLASHLEPEVLLVDEAVSVGDAGFQHRCLERIQGMVRGGITLVFVSHVPALISSACRTGILLDRGTVAEVGGVDTVLASYMKLVMRLDDGASSPGAAVTLLSWDWKLEPGAPRTLGNLSITLNLNFEHSATNPRFGVALGDGRGGSLINCSMLIDGHDMGTVRGPMTLSCRMHDIPLAEGVYPVWVSAMSNDGLGYLVEPRLLGFLFLGTPGGAASGFSGTSSDAAVRVDYDWATIGPEAGVDTSMDRAAR